MDRPLKVKLITIQDLSVNCLLINRNIQRYKKSYSVSHSQLEPSPLLRLTRGETNLPVLGQLPQNLRQEGNQGIIHNLFWHIAIYRLYDLL
ncbi:hypothetical protein J3459_016009 [Metarhizium acridum]|nr:hypothetical protein J3459_016009 [Metarhizium acridum]